MLKYLHCFFWGHKFNRIVDLDSTNYFWCEKCGRIFISDLRTLKTYE